MQLIYNKFILLIISSFFACTPRQSRDDFIYKVYESGDEIIITDKSNDRESLIVYILRYGLQNTNKKQIEEIVLEELSNQDLKPVLTSIYLTHILMEDDNCDKDNFEPLLTKYYKRDKDNSYPSYLLSYCYALRSDFDKYKEFLAEGNKKNRLDYYKKERKEILVNYFLDKTDDKLFAYSTQYYGYVFIPSVLMMRYLSLLRTDSGITLFDKSKINFPYNEIYKLGLKNGRK